MAVAESDMMALVAELGETLRTSDVSLKFERVLKGDDRSGLAPAYHFRIISGLGADVGHINLRIGETPHVMLTAGHIGFEITERERGRSYAYHACVALIPLIRRHYRTVVVTADPGNAASLRTIEKLGATFLGEVTIPIDDPAYLRGERSKKRFSWNP